MSDERWGDAMYKDRPKRRETRTAAFVPVDELEVARRPKKRKPEESVKAPRMSLHVNSNPPPDVVLVQDVDDAVSQHELPSSWSVYTEALDQASGHVVRLKLGEEVIELGLIGETDRVVVIEMLAAAVLSGRLVSLRSLEKSMLEPDVDMIDRAQLRELGELSKA